MRTTVLFALALILALAAVSSAAPVEKEKVPCTVCGYVVDKDAAFRTDYEGKTYYFCEAGCKAYFLNDPAPFAAGKDIDPVCGMAITRDNSVAAVQNGREIHFCSNDCKAKYVANPAEYEMNWDAVSNEVKKASDLKFKTTFEGRPYYFATKENMNAFKKDPGAYVYAECPVSGKVFLRKDAGATTTYKGSVYYFCCPGCQTQFKADPAKHMGPVSAAAQGCEDKDMKPADCKKAMESGQCQHEKAKKI